jgi:anti-sigma factor RsiW
MSVGDRYSDEKLQLFVDDEMNSSDRAEIMETINTDDDLSDRVCELVQLKDAVRLAYSEPPQSAHAAAHRGAALPTRTWLNAAAAVLSLAIGTLGGRDTVSAVWRLKCGQQYGGCPAERKYYLSTSANQTPSSLLLR